MWITDKIMEDKQEQKNKNYLYQISCTLIHLELSYYVQIDRQTDINACAYCETYLEMIL